MPLPAPPSAQQAVGDDCSLPLTLLDAVCACLKLPSNKVLQSAREVLGKDALATEPRAAQPAAVASSSSTSSTDRSVEAPAASPGPPPATSQEALSRRWSALSDEQDTTRHVLQAALDRMQKSEQQGGGGGSSSSSSRGSSNGAGWGTDGSSQDVPSWAQPLLGTDSPEISYQGLPYSQDRPSSGGAATTASAPPAAPPPQLKVKRQAEPSTLPWQQPPELQFAEKGSPFAATLDLSSQSALDAARARTATLPPLQSVVELTSAYRPPQRQGAAPSEETSSSTNSVGRSLQDGSGVLPDGTRWEKKSGEEFGEGGYWKRWTILRGVSDNGQVAWQEQWWEASDWRGMKEMGAEKSGNDAQGGAWRESWSERMFYQPNALEMCIERTAHKWAHAPNEDEWEEKWGEFYNAGGKATKWADKWGKQGPNVWHERWGEDYDGGNSDKCLKWTDKWAERLLPDGAREQWGDKWTEDFGAGRGSKHGEVWSVDGGGGRYQRWWNEEHYGDGRVRKWGDSTAGENWDNVEHMDTYYNPIPHFGFSHAYNHSPQLRSVAVAAKTADPDADLFGSGIDDL